MRLCSLHVCLMLALVSNKLDFLDFIDVFDALAQNAID